MRAAAELHALEAALEAERARLARQSHAVRERRADGDGGEARADAAVELDFAVAELAAALRERVHVQQRLFEASVKL